MTEIYEHLILDGEHNQIRLTISEFKDVEYLHLRKYYMSFDENWLPSNEGIAFPLDIDSTRELFIALVEILSLAESKEIIYNHFRELLENIYQK